MAGWSEQEIRAAITAYFRLLDTQARGKSVNKAAIYSDLSCSHSRRNAKAFERKWVLPRFHGRSS